MPDGYPVEGEAWLGNLLPRWNFCAALADGIDGVHIPLPADATLTGLYTRLTSQPLPPAAADRMTEPLSGANPQTVAALILASPTFQQH
jgi:hypothetical protein